MTTEQFEKYQEISEEIKPVKKFLKYCGRYPHKDLDLGKYRFSLKTLFSKNKGVALYREMYGAGVSDNTYELPEELQDKIIAVVENYVEEKEKELEAI